MFPEVISYGVRPSDIIDIKSVGKGVFVILKGISRDAEDKRRSEIDAATEKVLGVTLTKKASIFVKTQELISLRTSFRFEDKKCNVGHSRRKYSVRAYLASHSPSPSHGGVYCTQCKWVWVRFLPIWVNNDT